MTPRRTTTSLVAAGLAVSVLSGCGFRGAASIPLPGGEGMGDDAYELTIEFQDVLDLVEQSAVKVNDVTVGSVDEIEVDGYTARVVVRVNGDVELPVNTTASLRQTSLLGEKFVSLDAPPEDLARGQLRGGETIGLDRTERSAEIEEVLGALSLVLNGGSLEQLQVINQEVVAALEGREDRVKGALRELETFVGGLDEQKGQIVRVLDSLDRLSSRLVTERQTIATALEDIPAGVEVLTAQREDITELLTSLDQLEDVAVHVIRESKAATVEDLQALVPILTQLNEAGEAFPRALELLTTYPFPRTVFNGIYGDYANLFITLDLDARQIADAEGVPLPETPELPVPVPTVLPTALPTLVPSVPGSVPGAVPAPRATPSPSAPGGVPDVLDLPLVPQRNPLLSGTSGLLHLLMGGLA